MLLASFGYYPKWNKGHTEAILSWDVSGYYMYLPATFIYKDLKKCSFGEKIITDYSPTYDFHQAFEHESGNRVMKYSMGQAVMFMPAFFIGHSVASMSETYPADGFSTPYQLAIQIQSILVAILGLVLLRSFLRKYFNDASVAIALIAVVFGSNYLEYSSISTALTHNYLFLLYILILRYSERFYNQGHKAKYAIIIGLLVGLCTLTRPTELLTALIPILWGVNLFDPASIKGRLQTIITKFPIFALMGVCCILIGSWQLIYWKYASGDWIVYSYQDQGFSWLKPHIWKGLLSHKSGWLTYSPIMFFAVVGFYFLVRKWKNNGSWMLLYVFLFIYVAFSWDIWWYGSSLGQRTMVQVYPIIAFGLCAVADKILTSSIILKIISVPLVLFFIYLNLWFTHQAHHGGMLHCGMMTKAYYWKTLGRWEKDINDLKLLDTNEEYNDQTRKNVQVLKATEQVSLLNTDSQYSERITIQGTQDKVDWYRLNADIELSQKEYDIWKMRQMIVGFYNGEELIKQKFIRIDRLIGERESNQVYLDVEYPTKPFNKIEALIWNAGSNKSCKIKQLTLESFNEQ